MSDVLNGIDVHQPTEETDPSILEDLTEVQSFDEDESFEFPGSRQSLLSSVISTDALPNLGRDHRRALRSTCKEQRADPPTPPASCRLPTEIIQHIYGYLNPKSVSY